VGVCQVISCILHNSNLSEVQFDHEPNECVGHDAWKSEGLPIPPSGVVAQGWKAVLEFLRKAQTPAEAKAAAELKAAAEAKTSSPILQSHDVLSPQSLPPGFIDSLRGARGLAADVLSIKKILGGAAAFAEHSKVTQQQLEDKGLIRGRPELLLFYGAVCQGLQCMLHMATAFKTGSVQLDKNSSYGSYMGQVSDHFDDAVGAVGQAASRARNLATRVGFFEGAANSMASALDKVAEIADGIPIASFVLKGLSFIVNQVQGLKFDARMNRMIKSLFPDLNPLAWSYVVEEVARRVAVLCAPEIQALYSGTEDCRGRIKNWFRNKCSDYGLATLTSKAEDAVTMLALQKVYCVSQLALSDSVPEGLSEIQLADLIVRHVVASASAPAPAPAQAAAATSAQLSSAPPDSSPPHVALNDFASHDEMEVLRKKLDQQDALNKQLSARLKKIEKLVPQDKDNDATGSGGGLIQASSKSEVNAETFNTAAAQAVRPVQQQVVRVEHQLQNLTGFIMSHSDPVLKSHLEDLNNEAVAVMKKHDDVLGWQVRYMAVRRGTLFYGSTYEAVKTLSDGAKNFSTDYHVLNLTGCSVRKCPGKTDPSHFAFVLTTAQVNSACVA
jgi:hypothetical protein